MLIYAWKAAALLAASWIGAALLRRSSAAARHQMWMLGVLGALALPLLSWWLPAWEARGIAGGVAIDAPAMLVTARAASTSFAWLPIAWVTGSIAVALWFSRGHLAAWRLSRTAIALGFEDGIAVLRSARIGSPMTIGVVRPRVLLPASADAWSPERLRAVLVHELGHVRRRDVLVQLAAQLACALYWWNPLAWIAAARLRALRELACDDLVLAAGVLPSRYASDLLDIARASKPVAASAGMSDATGTEARIHRILDPSAPRHAPRRFVAPALALACTALLACVTSRREPDVSVGKPWINEVSPYPHGAPTNRGVVELSLVTAEVQNRLPTLEACYARRLAAVPQLAGTVVIHWHIAESGNVIDACVTKDTVNDIELVNCVNQLVLDGGRFPAPRGGSVDVAVPFVFTGA